MPPPVQPKMSESPRPAARDSTYSPSAASQSLGVVCSPRRFKAPAGMSSSGSHSKKKSGRRSPWPKDHCPMTHHAVAQPATAMPAASAGRVPKSESMRSAMKARPSMTKAAAPNPCAVA